nr:YncE family protein [Planctomycetota bacterium]
MADGMPWSESMLWTVAWQTSLVLALVRGRKRLEGRIRRILRTRLSPPEVGRSWTAVAFGGIITLTTVIALAQTSSESPEAASSLEPMAPAPFLGPIDVVASHDGKTLFVACADGKGIAVVDVATEKVSKSLAMPAMPTGLVLNPDGTILYVTCASPEGRVCSVDIASGKLVQTIPVGHGAIGPAISPDGKKLYVCNGFNNNVAAVDLKSREIALIPTLREPLAAAVTPDGRLLYVINHLPIDRADEYEVAAEITVIDTATNRSETVR